MDTPQCCIFVPCYNVERFVETTIQRVPWADLPPEFTYRVVFVDNDSSDGTWERIQGCLRFLKDIGVAAEGIRNPANLGYGGSNKVIFDYCLLHDIDAVAILHSDGQYLPGELPRLLRQFLAVPDCALFYGSRIGGDPLKGGMPVYKYLANIVLTWVQNLALGSHYREFHSGYRFYRMGKIRRLPYHENSDYYYFDSQIMFQIHHAGQSIAETTIPTFYGEEKSNINAIKCTSGIVANVFVFALHRIGLVRLKRFAVSRSSGR